MDNNKEHKNAIKYFKFNMWFDTYDSQKLVTHVYTDAERNIKLWKSEYQYNIKLYVYSHGWAEAAKVFLRNTTHGNVDQFIDDYFDSTIGDMNAPNSYRTILDKI